MQIPIFGAIIEYSTILGIRKYFFNNKIETTKIHNMQGEDVSRIKLRWDKKVDIAAVVVAVVAAEPSGRSPVQLRGT